MAENQQAKKTAPILLPAAETMPLGSSSFLSWLWFFIRPYRFTLIAFSIFRTIRFTILAMMPFILGLTINGFEQGWAFEEPERLFALLGGYFTLYGLALFSIVLFIHESSAQDRMIRGTTLFCIRHMNALPLSWHEEQGSGGKLQRVMTARNSLKQLYNMYKWFITPFFGTMLGVILSITLINAPPFFLLLYLAFTVSFFVVAWYAAKPLPGLHNRHNILLERLLSGVYEFVSAVRTVKAFNMEEHIQREARRRESEGHGAMRDVFRAIFIKWGALNTIGLFWIIVFLIACTSGVYQGWLTIGAFATSFYLALDVWKMLEQMVYIQDEFIEHRNGFMRLTETLKAQPKPLDLAPVTALPAWQQLSFNNVDFSYGKAASETEVEPGSAKEKEPALHDISFALKRGEKIALVGPSGAGKTTLVKLLMKQMWPVAGTIAVDDNDLRHIKSSEWLGQIGFVPQDVELFNMSIRDNVLLDRAEITSAAEYRAALEQAAFAEFVDSLPEGDETVIGERGIKLSGGQRQRLGIARALVRNAELVIFDEATSALDSLSEQAIQQAIDHSFAGKTLVVIAHRLSTVRHVDRIFVLNEGRLAEQGTFDELVQRSGTFAQMWALQSDHYAADPDQENRAASA